VAARRRKAAVAPRLAIFYTPTNSYTRQNQIWVPITLSGVSTATNQAVTKGYVDSVISRSRLPSARRRQCH